MKRIETKKPKEIKLFLRDTAAISPAIATLILIVIAAVAAAGVGILTQKAQDSANAQTSDRNLDAVGTVTIKGSTNALALTNALVPDFQKKYPGVKIEAGGGGLFRGLKDIVDDKVDVAGEWGPWPYFNPGLSPETSGVDKYYWPQTVEGVTLPARKDAVIQEGGANAKYWETQIGHDVVAIVSNIKSKNGNTITLNIVRDNATSAALGLPTTVIDESNVNLSNVTANNKGDYVLNINYSTFQGWYKGTIPANLTDSGSNVELKLAQYEYYSYAEQEFARFLRLNDQPWNTGTWQLNAPGAKVLQKSDKAVRDYISSTANSVGFLPLGFATGGVASEGKTGVISAYIENNKIAPGVTSALSHKHDVTAYLADGTLSGHDARAGYPSACLGAILARGESTYFRNAPAFAGSSDFSTLSDYNIHACLNEKIFFYTKGSPTGATKAFIDYATSPAGQKDIAAAGFVPLLD